MITSLRQDSTAIAIRQETGADIVLLLTTNDLGNIFGLASWMPLGDPDFAFALSRITAATTRFTFTHEIAHIFGCKHDNQDWDDPPLVFGSRGRVLPIDNGVPTVMAVTSENPRIMNFSNPMVQFMNVNTGITDSRDNALQMRNFACIIGNYMEFEEQNVIITFNGTTHSSNNENIAVCADIFNCGELSSILWEYSTDGINYYTFTAGPTQKCISTDMPLDQNLYFRVTAVCDDTNTGVAFHVIFNEDSPFGLVLSDESSNTQQDYSEMFTLSPNPNSGRSVFINFRGNNDYKPLMVDIKDSNGRMVLGQKLEESTIFYNKVCEVSLPELISGYYFVTIYFRDNPPVTKSLIIK